MTGGGPGVMEAANRGAKEAGGLSLGCNIQLPAEQFANPYLDRFVTLDHFFVRKVLLLKYSYAFVILPGGFGTMDEFFETLTLIQTGRMDRIPLLLFGMEFWNRVINFEALAEAGTISPEDVKLFTVVDSAEDGWAVVRKAYGLPEIALR